ncbi:ATP synthase F1 subunit epsilon [Qiania dongpingensis]|uniref:ATP synthase epsilon chain n=1 Tax=Qiania dongpingensis TaxID=2763669 RepID=A0A7G9G1I8_9FIRM|nr:ATP synthase F1 subunit epsilon [Qiania dongpingensis]QNM04670.1 ATP synthase F1 subunit epsilon [Qiania dongpingensis]
MADEKLFDLRVITPDRVFYEDKVEMVEMNTKEGAIGVYKKHVPTTCILSPGILIIHRPGGEKKKAALHGGFAEILKDKVTVLAEAAEWPEEIDLERAKKAKERAEERIQSQGGEMDVIRAEMALRRALARINAAK